MKWSLVSFFIAHWGQEDGCDGWVCRSLAEVGSQSWMYLMTKVWTEYSRRLMARPWHVQSTVSAVVWVHPLFFRIYSRIGPDPNAVRRVEAIDPVMAIPRL